MSWERVELSVSMDVSHSFCPGHPSLWGGEGDRGKEEENELTRERKRRRKEVEIIATTLVCVHYVHVRACTYASVHTFNVTALQCT